MHLTLFFEDGDACKCYHKTLLLLLLLLGPRHIQPSTYTNVRLLGGECIIPKSTQYVTVVADITQ